MQPIGNSVSAPVLAAKGAGPGKNDPKKIHDAAQQFESLMIGEMLKSVRENSSSGWLGSGDDDDVASDSAVGMAEQQFANALALGGGLGLSKMIEKSVTVEVSNQNDNASPSTLSLSSLK
jgi:Rod binding domain-containing protein